MNFFKKVASSVYSPEFYSQIPKMTLGSVLGYFFLLLLVVELVMFGKSMPEFMFGFSGKIKSTISEVIDTYPSNLVLTIKDGALSTNVKEPYYLMDKTNNKFAVIDTKTAYSADQFKKYNVPVWVTKDTVFYQDSDQIKSNSFVEMKDMVVNKELVNSFSAKISPWIPYFGPVVMIFALVTLYALQSFRLVYGFFLALLILLVAKMTKKSLTYKESYKVGIFAMTLPFILEALNTYIGWKAFPFTFTIIALIVVGVNFAGSNSKK